jgi:hypothetical protein
MVFFLMLLPFLASSYMYLPQDSLFSADPLCRPPLPPNTCDPLPRFLWKWLKSQTRERVSSLSFNVKVPKRDDPEMDYFSSAILFLKCSFFDHFHTWNGQAVDVYDFIFYSTWNILYFSYSWQIPLSLSRCFYDFEKNLLSLLGFFQFKIVLHTGLKIWNFMKSIFHFEQPIIYWAYFLIEKNWNYFGWKAEGK